MFWCHQCRVYCTEDDCHLGRVEGEVEMIHLVCGFVVDEVATAKCTGCLEQVPVERMASGTDECEGCYAKEAT